MEEVIEEAAPPSPPRAATPPVQQETEEEEVMDEEIVADSPPTREEAPTQGTDTPAAAAGAAATEEAGDASGDQGDEAPMEPTAAGAGGERTPSPQRDLEVGNERGAPTSPRAAPEAAAMSQVAQHPHGEWFDFTKGKRILQ